jgi:succinate dehydrogenase / fumarate reductase flavoprotein subunit
MQGLADGYFIITYTIGHYLAGQKPGEVSADHPEFEKSEAEAAARVARLLSIRGTRTVDSYHRELGRIMWEHCGMARNEQGLEAALQKIPALRERYWQDVKVPGTGEELNQSLEKAGRVADFLELGELMCLDALERRESCGGHFREEFQTPDGEARRDDERFAHVAAWEYAGEGKAPVRNVEPLEFEYVHLAQRSYK